MRSETWVTDPTFFERSLRQTQWIASDLEEKRINVTDQRKSRMQIETLMIVLLGKRNYIYESFDYIFVNWPFENPVERRREGKRRGHWRWGKRRRISESESLPILLESPFWSVSSSWKMGEVGVNFSLYEGRKASWQLDDLWPLDLFLIWSTVDVYSFGAVGDSFCIGVWKITKSTLLKVIF